MAECSSDVKMSGVTGNDVATVSAGGVPASEMPSSSATPSNSTSDRCHWYIGIVKRNTEKACRDRLIQAGYECYVATQTVSRQYSKTRRPTDVEIVCISSKVFIRVDEERRIAILKDYPFINRFMTDIAMKPDRWGRHPVAIVPDEQIRQLQYLLFHAAQPVYVTDSPIQLGDEVRIMRGSLKGLTGHVVRTNNETYISIQIAALGYALASISPDDVEKA